MATGPLEDNPVVALTAQRDDLARRCAAAEAGVERLTAEVQHLRARLEQLETARRAEPLSLFDEGEPVDRLTGDGSDPRVLSGILAATAVVAAMVTFLALINGNIMTPFGLAMVVITIGLMWAAAHTRVEPVEVSVVRGVVFVEQGKSSYRFDLRKPQTAVEMVGQPGEPGWSVSFPRRHLEPLVIDASMVDPREFVAKLREHRPNL